MKKTKEVSKVIKVQSVVRFPSHPYLMTVETADYMSGRARVVWFTKAEVLMTANVEIASLQLVRN
jgi:hypothetical protein